MTYYKTVKVVEVDYTSLTLEYYHKRRGIIEPALKEFFKDEETGALPDISYAFGPNDELIADRTMKKDDLSGEMYYVHEWTLYWNEVMNYVIYGTFVGYAHWLGGTWIDSPRAWYEEIAAKQAMHDLDAKYNAECEKLRNSKIQPYWNERLAWYEREDKVYRYEREKDEIRDLIKEIEKEIKKIEKEIEQIQKEINKLGGDDDDDDGINFKENPSLVAIDKDILKARIELNRTRIRRYETDKEGLTNKLNGIRSPYE